MELQIQDLIGAIKKDGYDAAQKQADQIIADAKKQAAEIIAKANEESESIIKKAKKEVAIMEDSAKVTAEHAKRDAILAFKRAVQAQLQQILTDSTKKALDYRTLAKLIIAAMGDEDPADYMVEVAKITDGLKNELADQLRTGLEIKINPKIHAGFHLVVKDGSGYLDCSDEEITQMLMPFFPSI